MTGGKITDEMIEAASDEAHRLASDIVLGCYGCGTAAVMIDRALEAHRIAALEEAAKAVEGMRVYHGMEPEIARIIRNLKGAGA